MLAARLNGISRRYGRHWALLRVSFDIPEGRTVLLTGPNGAGKTTLLRVLATALTPTRGHLELFGVPAADNLESLRRRIGLLTHKSNLYEDMTAYESLAMLTRFDRGIEAKCIPAVLERVGLAARSHNATRTFSAGMQRRLTIARLLLTSPDLVLLDEPFTQLDPEGVDLMTEVVCELKQGGATIVMSTHDIERGLALCDLHAHVVEGRLTVLPLAALTTSHTGAAS